MEIGLERADEHCLGQHAAQRLDRREIRTVVCRGCGVHIAHSLKHRLGQLVRAVVPAAEDGFEADAVDFGNGADRAAVFVRHIGKEAANARFIVRHGLLFPAQRHAAPGIFIFIDRVVRTADTFHAAGGKDLLRGHIVELELQRRAAGVADENFHIV